MILYVATTRLAPHALPLTAPRIVAIGASQLAVHDGSLASLTEAWIVERLQTLSVFANGTVEQFPGTNAPSGEKLVEEMLAHRSPYLAVLFESDRAIELEEGEQDYEPTYAIYIVVHNARPAAARKGDGQTPGTNLMRDLLRNALHNQEVSLSANGFWAGRAEFRGVTAVFQRADAFIMRAELVVREAAAA
jgi:hypothetical protein